MNFWRSKLQAVQMARGWKGKRLNVWTVENAAVGIAWDELFWHQFLFAKIWVWKLRKIHTAILTIFYHFCCFTLTRLSKLFERNYSQTIFWVLFPKHINTFRIRNTLMAFGSYRKWLLIFSQNFGCWPGQTWNTWKRPQNDRK